MNTMFKEKRNIILFVLFVSVNGLLGSFAYLAGISAEDAKETIGIFVPFLFMFFAIGGLIGAIVFIGNNLLLKIKMNHSDKKAKNVKIFLLAFVLILLSWLPYFLAYCPGIAAYDSYIQIGQILTGSYNEHHPIVHTLMIEGFYDLGCVLFKSPNIGIALYVICQSVLLSISLAFSLTVIEKKTGTVCYIVFLLISMIYPYNGYMAVSITKDIPFAAFFLLSLSAMILILSEESTKKSEEVFRYILLFISLVGSVVFRNNGKYALLFMLGILFITLLFGLIFKTKKTIKPNKNIIKVFAVSASALLVGTVILLSVSKVLCAVQGDRREMLSVPIQQLARTYVYHAGAGVKTCDDNTMDEESKALISEFILNDAATLYRADISDPVKRNVNTWVVVNKTDEFAKTYLKLLRRYPLDYVKAFFGTNAGYFNPFDKTHMHINEDTDANGNLNPGKGYVQTAWATENLDDAGLSKQSLVPGLYVLFENMANSNILNRIPVVNLLFVPGTFLFIYVNVLMVLLFQKKYKLLIPISLTAGYYITLFLGPTVQLRYIYPVMIAVPLMITICFSDKKEK